MKQREKLWTPGNWHTCIFEDDYYERPGIESDEMTIVVWGADDDREGVHGSTSQQAHANAQLISAAPDLVDEHEEWASLLGEVYVLIEQEDYDTAMKILDQNVTIDFKFNDGSPAAMSPALAKAYGEAQ